MLAEDGNAQVIHFRGVSENIKLEVSLLMNRWLVDRGAVSYRRSGAAAFVHQDMNMARPIVVGSA